MDILAVDDERMALHNLVSCIREVVKDAEIHAFTRVSEVYEFEGISSCEVAFLDIQLRGITGIELAKRLKEINPSINIIFVTGYSDYAVSAMNLRASGYLMKPIDVEAVKTEMNNLRHPVRWEPEHPIQIQTFGNFEIFCDGIPVRFERNRSREVLAYLIDIRGTSASHAEVASILWDDGIYDRARQKQLNNYIRDIRSSLHAVGEEAMFQSDRKGMHVDCNRFDCDYYRFLSGDVPTINSYAGKYMSSYSWAELTTAYLDNYVKSI